MESSGNTIAAISTPPGMGAIALIRLSGPQASEIAQSVWKGADLRAASPRKAHLGNIVSGDGAVIDQVLLTRFAAPASFTGEDMVEIACHGSTFIQQAILSRLIEAGAEPAGPGEFSMRAVINGKLDLSQAEGVADLISSTSRAAADIALKQMNGGISRTLTQLTQQLTELAALVELELDFSEEDVEFASRTRLLDTTHKILTHLTSLIESYSTGAALRDGISIAITGAPNAGKSSLLNSLLGDDRAIVSDIPGTTRDTIEAPLILGPYKFLLTDTAGLRDTDDPIEKAGIERTRTAASRAHILLSIIDSTLTPSPALLPTADMPSTDTHHIILLNKSDREDNRAADWQTHISHSPAAATELRTISTRNQEDIKSLKQRLQTIAADMQTMAGEQIITNERHRHALQEAREALIRVEQSLTQELPMDMLTQDIRESIHHLSTVTGTAITTPTLLRHLFAHFCIGK